MKPDEDVWQFKFIGNLNLYCLTFLPNQIKPDEDVRQFKFIGNLNLYRLTFLPNQMRTDGDVLAIQILTFQRPKKNSD